MAEQKKQYRVLTGISWYDDNRAEPGEIRDDVPKKSIGWLLEQNIIETVEEGEADGVRER